MTSFWTPTADLLHRQESTLNADERSSVQYFLAFIDEMDGVGRHSPEVQWARTARQIERVARELGSLADGATPSQIGWLEAQKIADLDSFQRARLDAIPGWVW